ncbi:hypothetical protein [uncultured Enterovirga sp.]|uniref:hypothetical protein n=1 Tax=uncultured Enterovirga sp. TaxID=2026352 RepID=UPI0035CC7891
MLRKPALRRAVLGGLFGLFAWTGNVAAEPVPALREGMLYASARGTLIAKGFQPVPSGNRDDARCSAGRQDVCNAYPETVSCSGTGAATCRFIFTGKGGATLTVLADGDDVGHLKVVTSRRSSEKDAKWQRAGR